MLNCAIEKFTPCGLTGVAVLAESHISIHTWPEAEYAAIDVFTCNGQRDPANAAMVIARKVGARKIILRMVERREEMADGNPIMQHAAIAVAPREPTVSINTGIQTMKIIKSPRFGKVLILNGDLQLCTNDEYLYHEPLVHPACVAHGRPARVLILGGGDGAAVREVLKWKSVRHVNVVDIDSQVVATSQAMLQEVHQGAFADPRVEVVSADAMTFLRRTEDRWDVVVSDLTSPDDSPSGELFGYDAFSRISRVMADDGVFAVQIGGLHGASAESFVGVVASLSKAFARVVPYHSFPVSFGEPWGFAIATNGTRPLKRESRFVDEILRNETSGSFRMFDGISWSGLLAVPKHIRMLLAEANMPQSVG